MSDENPTRSGISVPPPAPQRQPRRVMIVDGCRESAECLALLLGYFGHEVRVLLDGAAALEQLAGFKPDVVIIELHLPDGDGLEWARQIRSQSKNPRLLLIALSRWGYPVSQTDCAAAGFDHHVIKPVDLHSRGNLLEVVNEWFRPGADTAS